MYKRDIYLDIDDELNNYIKSVELDSNSRVWHFHLTVDYEPLDLTGKSVHFMAEKPDKTNVLNDCRIVDAEKGVVEVKLTRQVNAIPGHVKCLLKIIGDEGFVLKTKTFVVDVSKTLSDDAVVSSDEFGALDAALGRVQDIDNRFAQTNAQLSEIKTNHLTISIKDFGAKGDGLTDDTEALQEAINSTRSGGSIFFPNGTYLISKKIELPSNVSIVGETKGTTILANSNDFRFIIVGDNVSFDNITIDGNGDNFNPNKLIDTDYVNKVKTNNLRVTNCIIKNIKAEWVHAIGLAYTTNAIITNNIFDGFESTANGTVGDLHGSARAISVASENEHFLIANNIFKGMANEEDSDFIHVIGTQIVNNDFPYSGLEFSRCSGRIEGNIFYGFMKSAVKVQSKDVVIANNTIDFRGTGSKSAYAGVRIQNSENCVVKNNTVIVGAKEELSVGYTIQRSYKCTVENNAVTFAGEREIADMENLNTHVISIHSSTECCVDGVNIIGKNNLSGLITLDNPGTLTLKNIHYKNEGYSIKNVIVLQEKTDKSDVTFENIKVYCAKCDKAIQSQGNFGGSIRIKNVEIEANDTTTSNMFKLAQILNYKNIHIDGVKFPDNHVLSVRGSENIEVKNSILKGIQLECESGFNLYSTNNRFTSTESGDYCYYMTLDENGSYSIYSKENTNEVNSSLFTVKNGSVPLTTSSKLNAKSIDDVWTDKAIANYMNFIHGTGGANPTYQSFYIKTSHALDGITSGWYASRKQVILANGSVFYQKQSDNNKAFLACEKGGTNEFIEIGTIV